MGTLEDIEAHLCSANQLNDIGVPSASIAVLDEACGSIESHVITNGSEDTETVYQAASISKAITALAVAKLVDQGRISYETKALEHVPKAILDSISDSRTKRFWEYVTIGHLLSHRSGLSRHGMPGYSTELPTYEQMFAGVPPSNTERIRFLSFPGSQYSYSGAGFTLLQLILENAMGKPFAQLMEETVLEPLNMSRSRYGDLPAEEQNFTKAHHTAYTLGTETGRGYFRFLELAAAGLWTTPSDLLKAMQAIQQSLQDNNGKAFLSKHVAQKMLTVERPEDPDRKVALGWVADGDFFAHAGSNEPGYICYVVASHRRTVNESLSSPPSLGNGQKEVGQSSVAIMTNSALGRPVIEKLLSAIFYLKDWPRYSILPGGFSAFTEMIPCATSEKPDIEWSRYWQSWVGRWSGGWELISKKGLPAVLFEGIANAQELLPAAAPWLYRDNKPHEITFVVDGLDIAFTLTFEQGERVIVVMQEKKQVLRRL